MKMTMKAFVLVLIAVVAISLSSCTTKEKVPTAVPTTLGSKEVQNQSKKVEVEKIYEGETTLEGELTQQKDSELLNLISTEIPKDLQDRDAVILKKTRNFKINDEAVKIAPNPSKLETYEVEWHKVSFIQKEKGTDIGNFSVTYDALKEKVKILEARRIRSDGSFLRIDIKDIYDKDTNVEPKEVNYRNMRKVSFSLKDVQKGDFIETKEKVISSEKMGPGGFGTLLTFGDPKYPVLEEDLCFEPSKSVQLDYKLFGVDALFKKDVESGSGNLPKCIPFTFKNSSNAPVLYVTTWKDWSEYEKWITSQLKGKFDPDDAIKAQVTKLTEDSSKKEDAIRAIYHWIEKNIKYVQVYVTEDAGFVPTSATEVFKRKFGDCKEKSTLFISMLKAIDVKAYPARLNTTDEFDANLDIPMMYQFNHEITYVEDIGKFLDPTENGIPYPFLPDRDKDRTVFIIKEDKLVPSKTPMEKTPGFIRKSSYKISVDFDKECAGVPILTYSAKHVFNGTNTSPWFERRNFSQNSWRNYIENKWFDDFSGMKLLSDPKFENSLDDYSNPVILDLMYTSNLENACYDYDNKSATKEIMLPSFTNIIPSKDFYDSRNKDRKVPYIWSGEPYSAKYSYEITIPNNYIINFIPQSSKYSDPNNLFSYDINYRREGNTIFIAETFDLNKPILDPDEFTQVQKVFIARSKELSGKILLSLCP